VLGRKDEIALRINGLTIKLDPEDSGLVEAKPSCAMTLATSFS